MAEKELDRTENVEAYSGSSPTFDEENSIDLLELYKKLSRARRTIFSVTLLCFLVATAVAFLLPPRYTSTASVIPAGLNNNSSMGSMVAGQLSAMAGGDILGATRNPGDLYSGILQSRSIASEIVKRCHLMHVYGVSKEGQAERQLESDTSVVVGTKDSIVTLSVSGKSPGIAHDIASAYLDALSETNGRLALSQSSQRALFFGQQLEKEKDDLENAEVELKKTEEQSGLIAPLGQTAVEIDTIAQTQAQISVRQVQLAALRDSGTDQNPDVIRLRSEIGDLQAQLVRLQQGTGKTSAASLPTSKVPELQLEYVRKEREVKYHEALFDMLSRQYEAARLDAARDAPVLQVLDPASYPDAKSSPKRLYYMLGGLLFGLFSGCLWVFIREPLQHFRAALNSPSQV